jgi:hypothetical protein
MENTMTTQNEDSKPGGGELERLVKTFPRVPTREGIGKYGRWWWFCNDETMKDVQPVLVWLNDKYDENSIVEFRQPWPADHNLEKNENVTNWEASFHGPCLIAMDVGELEKSSATSG